MFRRLAAACALVALAVLAVGGGLSAAERGAGEGTVLAAGAATGVHGAVRARRVRSSGGPSSDRISPSDNDHSTSLGSFRFRFRWRWLPTAVQIPSAPVSGARFFAVCAPSARLASPALDTRSARGPPARS